MNKQRTYQIINNLIGDSLYPYKQFEYDLESSYDLIKANFNNVNSEYSVSNYRNSLDNISKYEKQEQSITDTLIEFIQTYFDGVNVNIRHEKDDIIWLLNQVKEIHDILTYVKNGEGYNYKTIAFIIILGVSDFIIDKFLNKKTHDMHSAIYKDWLKVHTYNRYVRYKNNKYTYQNSCLKHDEGYTIYSDNTIYTLKTFIIN